MSSVNRGRPCDTAACGRTHMPVSRPPARAGKRGDHVPSQQLLTGIEGQYVIVTKGAKQVFGLGGDDPIRVAGKGPRATTSAVGPTPCAIALKRSLAGHFYGAAIPTFQEDVFAERHGPREERRHDDNEVYSRGRVTNRPAASSASHGASHIRSLAPRLRRSDRTPRNRHFQGGLPRHTRGLPSRVDQRVLLHASPFRLRRSSS